MHEVLVNRLGGLSLRRKSVVTLTDRPDMTLDVYRGRKTTMQQQQQTTGYFGRCFGRGRVGPGQKCFRCGGGTVAATLYPQGPFLCILLYPRTIFLPVPQTIGCFGQKYFRCGGDTVAATLYPQAPFSPSIYYLPDVLKKKSR